jgi:GcrA cell cycle regulator
MNWTEQQDQYLRDHRGKLSSSQIAAELGCTRNSVLGRAHRLRLAPLRDTPNGWREVNDVLAGRRMIRRLLAKAEAKPKQKQKPPVVVVIPPTVDDTAIPIEQRKTFFELEAHDCRWPVGDPQEPGFFFCGAKSECGSYCAAHHHIAYNRDPVNARPKFNAVVTTQVLETSAEAA